MKSQRTSTPLSFLLLIICLSYLTISLSCNLLAFRQINFFGFTMGGSSLIYALLYVCLDMITRVGGRDFAIKMVFIFRIFDFSFTYIVYSINLLPPPTAFKNLAAFTTIVGPMPMLFWAGLLGSTVVGVIDIFLFVFFQRRLKNFLPASFLTTLIVLILHNIPTYYFSMRHMFPDAYIQMFFVNTVFESFTALIASGVANFVLTKRRSGGRIAIHKTNSQQS